MHTSGSGEKLLTALQERGWRIERSASREPILPPQISLRYPRLPEELTSFLGGLESCVNRDQNVWFLCREDYRRTDDQGFRWNENELMSLEMNEDDSMCQAHVRDFWDHHLPFMMAVHSDYDYLAVSLEEQSYGGIVHGFWPEFEEASIVAASFTEFLTLFELTASGKKEDFPLTLFL